MPDYYPSVTTTRPTGSSFKQSGTSRTQFWRPSRILAKKVMGAALDQFGQPIEYYPGSTQVPTDPYLAQGMEQLYARAAAGSPITGAAEGLGAATLRGEYLDPSSNPWLAATYQQGARQLGSEYSNIVRPDIESRFAGAGRSGGGSYEAAVGRSQQNLGQSLGDLATQIYGGAYEAERGRQQQALALSPMLQSLGYTDINEMMRAGAARQSEGQRQLDADVARWQFNQMEPWTRIGLAQGAYSQSPVISGTNWTQSGTAQQDATKTVAINPYIQQEQSGGGNMWLQILSSLI